MHGQSDLLRRQNAQKLQMERTLAMEEQATLDGAVKEESEKRQKVVKEMAEKLVDELQGMNFHKPEVMTTFPKNGLTFILIK